MYFEMLFFAYQRPIIWKLYNVSD